MLRFFAPEEEEKIIEAIRQAEFQTSGEIRVHLDDQLEGNALQKATTVFRRLKMHKTKDRNGVLIYLAPNQHQFAIIGDKGIDEAVPKNFWDDVRDLMQDHFRRQAFGEGVCRAIDRVGEKLRDRFPYQSDDVNELPDDISYG